MLHLHLHLQRRADLTTVGGRPGPLRTGPGSPAAPASPPRTQWLARGAVALVVLPTLLVSIAYRTTPLGSWWIELLQYLPYPAFLLPALAAVGLAFWRLGPVWRLLALLGLGLVLSVMMGGVLGRADRGSGRLRLMTYNIKAYLADHHPGGFDSIAREVALHAPDVLVMQDAAELTALRRADPRLAASLYAGRSVYSAGQYVVASRYPLRDCDLHDMSFRGRAHVYARCTVDAPGSAFDLITAHLMTPRPGLNAARRERANGVDDWQQNFDDRLTQARRIALDAAPRNRPLVIAGDLNAPETSPVIRALLKIGLRDAFSNAGRGYGYTHGHSLKLGISFLRIDHILVSPELGVHDCFVGGSAASEHRPVVADLWLRRAAG